MPENRWANLAVRLAIAVGVATVLIVGGRGVGLALAPLPTVLVALVIAALTWMGAQAEPRASQPAWVQPHPPAHSARYTADIATRRVANMFVRAQPGAAFEAAATAQMLGGLVEQRLRDHHDVGADDPLTEAEPHLSADLLRYLHAARAGKPQPLTRRALHAHLKEIDQL